MTSRCEPSQESGSGWLSHALGLAALALAVVGLLLSAASAALFVSAWQWQDADGYWGYFPGALLLVAGLLFTLLALPVALAVHLRRRRHGPRRAACWSARLGAAAIIVVALTGLLATWELGLARPSGAELHAAGHDRPAHIAEARWVLLVARLDATWYIERAEGARLSGLVPVHRPLPEPAAHGSVFTATRDEGGIYLATSHRGGALVRTDLWAGESWLALTAGGWFDPQIPEAQRLVLADLGGEAEAIRYVHGGYGVWVVARAGERERGALAYYQGSREPSWPREGRVYSGAAILHYLQESAEPVSR